jgi:uncharacterized membrane protein YozB (DUF420 family)
LLQPRSHGFVATRGTKKNHRQRSLGAHTLNVSFLIHYASRLLGVK